jgi:hypothetical protein
MSLGIGFCWTSSRVIVEIDVFLRLVMAGRISEGLRKLRILDFVLNGKTLC